ncbi:protein of unknown function [Roseovarius azorensis]|uniref:DUF4174 domain-containing protein n=1 Tax=Roseovarius azorensis TaxID=1287727 RepID=A0A1H7SYP8_9RHOB|nr:DUF4174 domain-containing protein [Roseovarius azorensis]SEL77762.1 protein of unknown function [Roseovarius azorensis]
MKHIISFVFALFTVSSALAQETDTDPASGIILDARDVSLDEFSWVKRPLVIFADTPADPRFIEQMGYLTDRLDVLDSLDVVVITDTDPAAQSELRRTLRPRGFGLVLIGKDGVIYLRKPAPWKVREITRTIDKLPVRQQELRERPGGS